MPIDVSKDTQVKPPPLEFWRRFRLPHLSPRSLLISSLALLLLLVLGLTVVAAVKNTFKEVFTSSLPAQPTTTPEKSITSPSRQPQTPYGKLPQSCYGDPESGECKGELQEIIDKECGGDLEAPACEPYFQEAVVLQAAQECQNDPDSLMCQCLKEKDPGGCLGQEIRSETFGVLFCELAKQPYLGTAFVKLCQQFSGSTTSPKNSLSDQLNCQFEPDRQDCQLYFETTCSEDPYTPGCENYCLENPQAPVCLQRCQTDLTIPGCQELLSTYCPDYPYQPECAAYFETTCAQEIYNIGCIHYCQQNPYSQGCVGFLLNYCRGNLTDPLCMSVLCDRAPQLCTLCQQFPNLCNQLWTRF